MHFSNTPNRPIDLEGKEYRISRSVAISIVLFFYHTGEQKRYLPLVKRGSALTESGKVCLPCGYLDRDETAAEAMRREVREEVGLDLNELLRKHTRHGSMQQPFFVDTNPKNHNQNVALEYFLAFDVDQLPPLSCDNSDPGEVAEVVWCTVEKACTMEMAFCHELVIKERRERTQRNLGKR